MSRPYRIGFDAKRIVANGTGLGSYGRTLVNSLSKIEDLKESSLLMYAPDKGREELYSQIRGRDNIEFRFCENKTKLGRALWREKGVVKDLVADGVELFHGLSGQLPQGIAKTRIKSVVTIHDLIFMVHPEWYSFFDVKIYRHKFYRSIEQADVIVAISECTKKDILRFSDISEDKIRVVYQSYNKAFFEKVSQEDRQAIKAKYSLPERFVLNVGTIEERKNVLLAVKAVEKMEKELHLVIVGRRTKYADKVERYVKEHNLQERVHIIDGVIFEELAVIYSLASVFVYPSVYEGFGIPIIEAIANGLPVVACTGSCLEEAGGEACIYVNKDDVASMREAIGVFWNDKQKREESVAESRKYIKRFEDSDLARQYSDLYRETIGR